MAPNHYHIADLITKCFHDSLSEEESNVLKSWLEESEENQRFFNRLKKENTVQKGLDFFYQIDFEDGWKAIQRKRKINIIKKIIPYLGTAAAVLLVSVGIGFYVSHYQSTKNETSYDVASTTIDFLPAASIAQLKLSDGRVVNLEKRSFEIEEVNDVKLSGSDGELTYTSDGALIDTLAFNTLIVPKKGFYKVTLSDGTKVWLNSDSKLSFPVKFNVSQRKVNLIGEAYFEVSKDPSRPFSVEVQGKTLQVLGTKFNVNSYQPVIKTTLFEGSIKVMLSHISKILSPGQEAIFTDEDISIRAADIHKVGAWRNEEFFFKKDTITEIMEEIGRWYDVEIFYQGGGFDKRFSGNISRTLALPEVLGMLRFLSGYDFKLQGRTLTVYHQSTQMDSKQP